MSEKIVKKNSSIVLREEFDEWALLVDPDNIDGVNTLDPVAVSIWKNIDGKSTPVQIFDKIKEEFKDVPKEGLKQTKEFIEDLVKRGYASYGG